MKDDESMFNYSIKFAGQLHKNPSCPCSRTQEECGHKMTQTSFPKPIRCPLIVDPHGPVSLFSFGSRVYLGTPTNRPVYLTMCSEMFRDVQRLPDKKGRNRSRSNRDSHLSGPWSPWSPWIHNVFVIAPAWHKALAAPLDDTPGTGQNIQKHRWSCDICRLFSPGFCLYHGYIMIYIYKNIYTVYI